MASKSGQESNCYESNDNQEWSVSTKNNGALAYRDFEDEAMKNTSGEQTSRQSDGRRAQNESSSSGRGSSDVRRHSDRNRGTEGSRGQRQLSGEADRMDDDEFRAMRDRKLEVCREYIHNRCRRSEFECRYAHPPPHIEVVEGSVTCCFDYSRGRCSRSRCRFMHPPPHLMPEGARQQSRHDMNFGRNLPPYIASALAAYMSGALGPHSGYSGSRNGRNIDKVEVCREFLSKRCEREQCRYAHPPDNVRCDNNHVTACMDFVNGNCERDTCRYFHPPTNILERIRDMIETQGLRKRPRSNDAQDGRADRSRSHDVENDGRRDETDSGEGDGDAKKFKSARRFAE